MICRPYRRCCLSWRTRKRKQVEVEVEVGMEVEEEVEVEVEVEAEEEEEEDMEGGTLISSVAFWHFFGGYTSPYFMFFCFFRGVSGVCANVRARAFFFLNMILELLLRRSYCFEHVLGTESLSACFWKL